MELPFSRCERAWVASDSCLQLAAVTRGVYVMRIRYVSVLVCVLSIELSCGPRPTMHIYHYISHQLPGQLALIWFSFAAAPAFNIYSFFSSSASPAGQESCSVLV